MKIKLLMLAGMVSVIGLLGMLSLRKGQSEPLRLPISVHDIPQAKRLLSMAFRQHDAQTVAVAFQQAVAQMPLEEQHRLAHLFGEVLYRETRLPGISVCDSSFGFGCYHGFIGTAVATEGPSIVKKIDEACVASQGVMGLGCPHGIGHGLGEFFGPAKLTEQLDLCRDLSWKGKYLGCQGGVFMEYNFPTVISEEKTEVGQRTFAETEAYTPCPAVAAPFRNACYLELPSWWLEVLAKDYSRMGMLCQGIRDAGEQESCFLGIGYALGPKEGYDADKSVAACRTMPNRAGETLCRAGASWTFFANPDYRDAASRLCEGLPADNRNTCSEKSDLLGVE